VSGRVLAIHHEDWKLYLLRAASRQKHKNLGSLEETIRAAGLACDYHESATGQPLRGDLDRYSHVVVLGGNMAAYDDERHRFLREEMRLVEDAIARGIPVLGICLGAQLLARIHGARVYPGPRGPELAWSPLALTEAGRREPFLRAFPQDGHVFQWHHDTFDLPAGAVHLARSDAYANQAFCIGRKVWAFQFHIEADERLVRSWLRSYARDVKEPARLEEARAATDRHITGYMAAAREFMRGFLSSRADATGGDGTLSPGGQPPGGSPASTGEPGNAG
jgi:GMP synthase (glutamine-hydrolysing)